ncbi:MATE efflux family protein [Botrytis cinerea]
MSDQNDSKSSWLPKVCQSSANTSPTSSPPNEQSSLLPRSPEVGETCELEDDGTTPAKRWLAEFLLLLRGSVPVILAYALQNSLQTISVLIVGRLSPEALATAAFSYMFAMSTAWLIALGGTTALDTLASSSFTGSKNPHDLEIMRPGTYVLLITSPLSAGLNYLFIHTFNLGLIGAPLATGLSYWLSFLLLVLYSRFITGHQCWGGFTIQSLHNLGTFSRLALLGVIHVGTEWWAFEIVALAAGRLGTIPLAAQSVIMTTDQVMNTIPFGIGVAASSRVGNLLGARNAKGAARAANVAAWLSMVMGFLVLIVLMSVKNFYARIFNDDLSVIKLTAEVMPYVALFQIADGLNGSCGGSLRGMGRQHVGAVVNFVSYYCGALPLGIWLAFHGWGLGGLWVGQCIALYIVGALEWIIVAWSDWEGEVKRAFGRMEVDDRIEAGIGGLDEREEI